METKAVELFSKDARASDGLQGCCKVCNAAQRKEFATVHRDRHLATRRAYQAAHKEESRLRSAKYRKENPEKRKEIQARNRAKHREKYALADKLRREANPEARRLAREKWDKAHPECRRTITRNRRAKILGLPGRITKEHIVELFSLQNGKCPACKKKLGQKYHIDHIVPIFSGGSNERANIQLLCQRCNCSKSKKDPIEFMQSRGFLL